MKEIPLNKGMVALVDDEDYERCMQYKWFAKKQSVHNYYAYRNVSIGDKKHKRQVSLSLHRFVLGLVGVNVIIDHKDRDTLNDQKDNLRICTTSQNCMNKRKRSNSNCDLRGVQIDKRNNKFTCVIWQEKKNIHLGSYITKEEAGHVRDFWSAYFHKDFANFNFENKFFETNLNLL